jgi:hypothetical protein
VALVIADPPDLCKHCLWAQFAMVDGGWDRSRCDIPTHLRQKKGRMGDFLSQFDTCGRKLT